MNKILLFFVVLMGAFFVSCAQTKPVTELSLGGEFGLPTGQVSRIYGSVFGASAKIEIPVSASRFYLTVTSGFSAYLVKFAYNGLINNAVYIPLELGGKYYFSRIGYFEGDVGTSFNTNGNYSSAKTAVIYAPVIGFSAPTNKHKATVDIGIRFDSRVESGGTINQLALRVAYRFGLTK